MSAKAGPAPGEQSYFEQQREALVGEIAQNLEQVLQNINKLNRSLEGVIAVGNEFGSVEALWSQFESVMARDPDAEADAEADADADADSDAEGERDGDVAGEAEGEEAAEEDVEDRQAAGSNARQR